MTTPFDREQNLFNAAQELPAGAGRDAFLGAACAGDAALHARIQALLRTSHEAEQFFESHGFAPGAPAGTPHSSRLPAPLSEQPGDTIGRYKLLQKVGEGGCGVVYMAEQSEPVRRKVALKVIKLGMDTKSVIARFEAERQALAMMDHPNIAKVLDGGATHTGRPYFVMELVRGVPITKYCDANNLPTEQRLNLFTQVCSAIHHAHQKGIIHRDIKPSNILVTLHDGVPVPKVIDFGIAKATEVRLTDRTLFTELLAVVGTPAYMSPEQAEMSGLDVDTRADIYSLGVLLYELLTGRPPFDPQTLHQAGLESMRKIIREVEPPIPSTSLNTLDKVERTSIARQRGTEPNRLTTLLRGDLDWIVMKALEKDRTRRYESASAFAQDIQRHLGHQAVLARPPSRAYQLRKLLRRNRLAFAAGAAVFATLLAGIGVSTSLLIKERAARERAVTAEREQARLHASEQAIRLQAEAGERKARTAAAKSEQVAQFLKEMLQGVGPARAMGRDTTVLREILDATTRRLGESLREQPEVEAELRATLGAVYSALGELAQAETMQREALSLRNSLVGERSELVADSQNALARVLINRGFTRENLDEAQSLLTNALAIRTNLHGTQHPGVAMSLYLYASTLQRQGRLPEAEAGHREALRLRRQLLGNDHPDVASSLDNLALVLLLRGADAEAATAATEAVAIQRRRLGNDHPDVASSLNILARALQRKGDLSAAEAALRDALAIRRKVLPAEHPDLLWTLNSLASVLRSRSHPAAAEQVQREIIVLLRKQHSGDHADLAYAIGKLASDLATHDDLAAAEALSREALAMRQRLFGGEHQLVAEAQSQLASVLGLRGHAREAEALHRAALALRRRLLGSEHPEVAESLRDLAGVLQARSAFSEAEPLLVEAWQTAQLPSPPRRVLQRSILDGVVRLFAAWARADPAQKPAADAWQARLTAFDAANPGLSSKRP